MKTLLVPLMLLAVCTLGFSQIHVQVVPADTVTTPKPVVLDSTAAAQAAKMYTLVQNAEWTMRDLQKRLFSDIPDAAREDQVRQQIATALLGEQSALWDFQIDRAAAKRDKSLLKAFQTAFTRLSADKSPLQQSAKQELKKVEKLLEE